MSSIAINNRPVTERVWLSLILTDRATQSLILFGAMLTALTVLGPPSGDLGKITSNALFIITSGGATLFCVRTARRLGNAGLPWLAFAAGSGCWFLGQLVWSWYDVILWTAPPYPSLADVGYSLFYPFMFGGLTLLIRQRIRDLPLGEVLLDSLIVVVAFALVAYELFVAPLTGSSGLAAPELVITLGWEVVTFGLVLLAGIALFIRADLLMRGPLSILLLGFIAFTASNVAYGQQALDDTYTGGSLTDLGWQLGFIAIASAAQVALRSAMPSRQIDHARDRRASLARIVMMVGSVLIVTAMAAYAAAQPRAEPAVIVLVLLAGTLLAVRLGYAALQTEHLIRRTRERDRLAGVVSASSAISSTLDLDELLPLLATAAKDAVGRARGEVYVFSEDMSVVEAGAHCGFSESDAARLASLLEQPVGAYVAERRVIETLKPTLQVIDEPGIPDADVAMFAELGKLHSLITPLIAHDRVVGVVDTWTPLDTTPFEPADIAAAAAIGQQAGLAIHNARLLAGTRQHAAEQEALLRVTQAAVSSLDLDAVLAEIAQASLGVANAEACAIEIWDRERGDSVLAAEATIDAWPGTSAVGKRLSFDDWPISPRVLHEQVTLNLLATDDILSPREQEHLRADDTNSMLMVPLVVNGVSLGILNLFSRNPRRFTRDEIRLASDLAAQISIAIDRARLHEALRERADTDGLTGLLNHRAILEQLDAETARARREAPPLSILMIDLDGFKQVNDTYGHLTGDQLLRETAAFLRAGIRDIDQAGRYGGDEFLLLLPNTDNDDARQLASRLLDLAEDASLTIHGKHFPIQISIGIATTPDDGLTRQELIAVADTRMYEAKSARRWIVAGAQG
ncbi:MAG TPA: sensor domain-containing diguanylate cyclase [Thermomicrobiales bacterium]|nr:sensor domain-containing diguanylate cyclase [Thermomicrobiales bacterium]